LISRIRLARALEWTRVRWRFVGVEQDLVSEETFEQIVRRLREGEPATTQAVKRELQALTAPRSGRPGVEPGKDWYVVRVELLSGLGEEFDPPSGRDFLVSPQHSFRQFANAINQAFARWDLGHLYAFRFADGL